MVVGGVANGVAVMRLRGRIIRRGRGIGSGVGGTGKIREDGSWDGECEGGAMGKGTADVLGGDGGVSGGGGCSGTEDHGGGGADGDRERAG